MVVYKQLFTSLPILRSKTKLFVLNNNTAAILLTCRKICEEATPEFYKFSKIHHSIGTWSPRIIVSPPSRLQYLRFLSINSPDHGCHSNTGLLASLIIRLIDKYCPLLEQLTVHFVMNYGLEFPSPAPDGIHGAICAIALLLEQFSIISSNNRGHLVHFCSLIAPFERWAYQKRSQWPELQSSPKLGVPKQKRLCKQELVRSIVPGICSHPKSRGWLSMLRCCSQEKIMVRER